VTPLGMRILTSYSRLAGVQQGRSCYENGCDEDLIPQSPGHETILSNFPLICRANMPSMLTPQRCDAYQSQNSNHQLHPEIEIIIDNPERGRRRRRLQHGSMQAIQRNPPLPSRQNHRKNSPSALGYNKFDLRYRSSALQSENSKGIKGFCDSGHVWNVQKA